MNGFEATRRIMQIKPTPIVIISATYNKEDVDLSFKAIEAGALSILEKPKGFYDPDYQQTAKQILTSIKTVAGIKLITRRYSTKPFEMPPASTLAITEESKAVGPVKIEAVGIGASLGGPKHCVKFFLICPAIFLCRFMLSNIFQQALYKDTWTG